MSEDLLLKCLIAFVLGFLVARMMRMDGLMVGAAETWVRCTHQCCNESNQCWNV